jgi:hypothetical protein
VAVSTATRHIGRKEGRLDMSIEKYQEGPFHTPGQAKPEQAPKPYPWCLACGFQHRQATHCDGCNGDHPAGYCMTNELAADLARVGELRTLVARAADHLFHHVLHIVRSHGGE